MGRLRSLIDIDHECDVEIKHIREFLLLGVEDKIWLPQIAAEKRWAVITADSGSKSREDDKLPKICDRLGITHIVLSPAVHRQKSFEKAMAILGVWRDMVRLIRTVPAGTRLVLRKTHGGHTVIHLA